MTQERGAESANVADPARLPLRRRPLLAAFGGGGLAWLGMAGPFGAATTWLLVLVGLAVSILGVLHALRTFEDPSEHRLVPGSVLLRPGLLVILSTVATYLSLRLAVSGTLARSSSLLVPLAFIGALSSVGWFLDAVQAHARPKSEVAPLRRRFYRREGYWLLAIATLLFLPTLGTHSLTDPWETHYGEVSREILSRRDWISLWWANEGWFFSKPVLVFWLQAGAMSLLGVDYQSGGMLKGAPGLSPAPEWAVRFPIFLCALLAAYLLYAAVARLFGRRAGLWAGLALTTMPQWSLISHQTMTDMPFVAAMTAAVAFVALATAETANVPIKVVRVAIGRFQIGFSGRQLLIATVLLLVLPQILYLVSRNVVVNMTPAGGLRIPPIKFASDLFSSGSPGNCGVWPGIPACEVTPPAHEKAAPILQAALWVQGLVLFLFLEWRENRRQSLYFLAAILCAAISTLAKGPAGIVFPFVAMAGVVVLGKRWNLVLSMKLPSGAVVFGLVVLPWFVAMFVRHGSVFTNRLLFHDMFERAFGHVHDTNRQDDVSFRYYLWQLGYGCLPWLGVLPRVLANLRLSNGTTGKVVVEQMFVLWGVTAFALFSFMQTKFHHYILPVLPPLAALIGIGVARWLRARPAKGISDWLWGALGVALLLGATRDLLQSESGPTYARLLHLFTYDYARVWPQELRYPWTIGLLAAGMAAATLGAVATRARAVSMVGLLAAMFTAFCLWTYLPESAPHWGQRGLVLHYMREQSKTPGLLIAYQMNWKGENFYTGGKLAIFVDSGKSFRDYLSERRKKGERVFYVLLPSTRIDGLKSELRGATQVEPLTSATENNKFTLVRVRY